jgi:F-type H+-transporting ATPase subunit b
VKRRAMKISMAAAIFAAAAYAPVAFAEEATQAHEQPSLGGSNAEEIRAVGDTPEQHAGETQPGAGEGPGDGSGHGHGDGSGHGKGAHGDAAHGEGHSAHGEHAPGPINWFDFSNKEQPPYGAYLINFGILVFVYVRFGKKPVVEGLAKRRETIMKEIEEAAKMQREAEERAKIYQAKLTNLDSESAEARSSMLSAGEGEKLRILGEAKEKADRLRKDTAFLLEQEAKEAAEALQREAVNAAVASAQELLKRGVTAADQARFAEDYLKTIETMAARRASGSTEGGAA